MGALYRENYMKMIRHNDILIDPHRIISFIKRVDMAFQKSSVIIQAHLTVILC